MEQLKSIDLRLFEKLQDKEFRDSFFEQEFLDDNAFYLRALRKLRKLRQIDVAAASGMKQSAISRIEQAEYSSWNCKTLLRMAQALNAKLTITWHPAEIAVEQYKTIDLNTDNSSVLKAREQSLAANGNQERKGVISFNSGLTDRPVNQSKPSTHVGIAGTILGSH